MSEFLRALSRFRGGDLSREQLLGEVERLLAEPGAEPVTMLASLDANVQRTAIPPDLHDRIAERLLEALDVVPDGSGRLENLEGARRFRDTDGSATIVVDVDSSVAGLHLSEHQPLPQGIHPTSGRILKHRFRLLECIGEGGMGRVFKALDLRRVEAQADDVYVAVKLLTRSFREYGGSLPLLQREAAKLQDLPHPNIVRVIDCDRDGQTVFMTMEFLAGQPLKKRLADAAPDRLPREEALRVLNGIAAALSFAHDNGIVHGDLKPGNVILTDDGEIKVIDFGIARVIARVGTGPRQDTRPPSAADSGGASALTPSYASPEMLEQAPADPRDDVYALACMAHEMLTGAHPFDRMAATAARDSNMKLVRRRGLSRPQFKALVGGLQFEREKRTPTVQDLMRKLRGDRPTNAKRLTSIMALGAIAIAAVTYFTTRFNTEPAVQRFAVGEDFRDCATCPLMKVLPAGHFDQGAAETDTEAQPFELPRHAVILHAPLAYGVQEVTKAQFREFADSTSRDMKGCANYDGTWAMNPDANWTVVGFQQTASHPVTCVSWNDASAYARWLSETTGHRYRLPSASEWEYAARGGRSIADTRATDNEMCATANVADQSAAERFPGWNVEACSDGYVFTAPVGAFAANELGLSDLFGNVFEWVQDCWHENYEHAPTDGSAWVDGPCLEREMRGGSWFTTPTFVRASYRNRFPADYRSNTFGFRVVRELEQ